DRPLGRRTKTLFTRLPQSQRWFRNALNLVFEAMTTGMVFQPAILRAGAALGRLHLRRQVRDADLRAALTPSYSFGCKRPTFSNTYYPALDSDNVDVVTSG